MSFELTNSLVTFQIMMNEIFWDLINIGEVASFIDNIIIGMQEEKRHNEIVKEVVNKLAENDLYIKLEKCKQKIKEVRFLGVVIGPEEIKIDQEKIREVLEWLTPKEVKDIQKFLGLANYYWWLIKDFIAIARPLHDIINKDQKWKQTKR